MTQHVHEEWDSKGTKQRSLESLVEIVRGLKCLGKRIVVANGIFDLIHAGHVRYLNAAKDHGDILIVAINDDASAHYLKGPGRPIVPIDERAEIIAAMECVDYVVTFSEVRLDRLLQVLCPDIHAKGTDYTVETVPEQDIVRSYGGEVVIVGGPKVSSSTRIVEKVYNACTGSPVQGEGDRAKHEKAV